jgi:hypothetical protein
MLSRETRQYSDRIDRTDRNALRDRPRASGCGRYRPQDTVTDRARQSPYSQSVRSLRSMRSIFGEGRGLYLLVPGVSTRRIILESCGCGPSALAENVVHPEEPWLVCGVSRAPPR